jgi:hypothetical protein
MNSDLMQAARASRAFDAMRTFDAAQSFDAVQTTSQIEYVVPVDPMDDLQCESCQ